MKVVVDKDIPFIKGVLEPYFDVVYLSGKDIGSDDVADALAMAILAGDEKTLMVAPGIGKKIAQRVILELKDKMSKQAPELAGGAVVMQDAVQSASGKASDAAAALAVLGYSTAEIGTALKGIDVDSMPLDAVIKQALRNMVK